MPEAKLKAVGAETPEPFKVENNIPMPEQQRNSGMTTVLGTLEIGQSFFIPKKSAGQVNNVLAYARYKFSRKFAARTVEGGVRIWRTE